MILQIASLFWITFVGVNYFISNKSFYIYSLNKYTSILGIIFFALSILILFFIVFLLLKKTIKVTKVWHYILLFFFLIPVIGLIRFEIDTFAIYHGPALESEGVILIQPNDPVINPSETKAAVWEEYSAYFETKSAPSAIFNIGWKLFEACGFAFLVSFIVFILGFWPAKVFLKEDSILIKFGIGTVILSILLFFLAKLSLFDKNILIIVSLVIFSFAWQPLKEIYSLINEKVDFRKYETLILSAILFILAMNFLEVIEPLPGGSDDYSLYLNLPKLLAAEGAYVHNFYTYAYGLIQGFILVLSGTIVATKTLSMFFAIGSLIATYNFFKKFTNRNYSALMTLIFICVPTIFIHSYLQLKVELPLYFFSVLALTCLYDFLNKKSYKYIFLAGLFAGFAISIKLTAVLLALSLTAMLFFQFRIKYILLLFLGFTIPILPWAVSNILINKNISLDSFIYDLKTDISINYESLGINSTYCTSSITGDPDYERYSENHETPFLKYLLVPWDQTMSVSAKSFVTNISYILLALCPLSIFALRKADKIIKIFFVGALVYWLFWILLAKGVIWYGISGFLFLLILIFISSQFLNKWIFYSTVIVFILASLFFRTNIFLQRTQIFMPYLSGLADENEYINYQRPGFLYMVDILNKDPEVNIYIYKHSFLKYFVSKNNSRVFFDTYLDTFSCLYQDGNQDSLLQRLKQMGVSYVVLIKSDDFTTPYLIQAEAEAFDFANNKLKLEVTDNSTYVYKVI